MIEEKPGIGCDGTSSHVSETRPESYVPSIETKYGRSIAEWEKIIAACGNAEPMAIVGYLKSEHRLGHGHATLSSVGRWQGTRRRPHASRSPE